MRACLMTGLSAVGLSAALLVGCGSDDSGDESCRPNSLQSCATPEGEVGTKICLPDGTWGEECSLEPQTVPAGGATGSGGTGG